MNCHAVQQLLSTERDEALGADSRAALETHVAGCAACRRLRGLLAESAEAWRATTVDVRVPDARLKWQRIRRRLNGDTERAARPAQGIFTLWRSATLAAAAAAVAFGLFLAPAWFRGPPAAIATAVAATDSVEVGGDASATVFVDDKSGWLVVWAADATEKAGS